MMLIQRAVLTAVVALLVLILPLGDSRIPLAWVIILTQAAATLLIQRRQREPIDELGAFMLAEHGLVALAGVICPPAYIGANMLALASLAVNAPYLTRHWLRRVTPITVAATIIAPLVHDIDHAPTVIGISTLLSLHMAFNRSGAVVIAEAAVARAQWDAEHDALTGLANRRLLVHYLDELRPDRQSGLLLVDLDDFKRINDTYGHDVGDDVLREVAERLSGIDDSVLVVRLGGDEFALLTPGGIEQTSELAHAVLNELDQPICLPGGGHTKLGGSVGLAHSSMAHKHELLRFADIAMFEAKREGSGSSWYSPGSSSRATRADAPGASPN